MPSPLRKLQIPVYIIIAIASLFFFVISSDYLIFGDTSIENSVHIVIGRYYYYLFAVSLIFLIYGLYESYSGIKDTIDFNRYIGSESKKMFMEHLTELERISKRFDGSYEERLEEAKKKWKLKSLK
ncbi:DUF3198 domain-containing protein [Picrophilus oshimae]|uniref:Hypothetical membrane associated protein n=1 Tax=Picrophilus torridus (strain ATCC 700027 / DSM 9790 / JCM 10055 / NBRC 100828 / KAW 2/3) TaxID=1122961 RepID=Q6L1F3_PICTO|nr:DUF3198 domain-containing protein [Picrophilus oshimae]AAT43199.1 hypothetical membrane associated protein [Picrophilus oshimae DSM 9789]